MTTVTIELDPATDSALRARAAAENVTMEELITRAARETVAGDAEAGLEAAWTPEAVSAVRAAEAELARGGGIAHAEVMRRTRTMLGR